MTKPAAGDQLSIVVDPRNPGGINSPHGLILFDGVCVLCSRGCSFVSKRDRRGFFRFVPMQLAEGRALAEQIGINPDRPNSFAFVANGRAYVKSEAVLRIARELPHWQWTWLFHLIPRVIRDATYDLVARNRYRRFGRRDACLSADTPRRTWVIITKRQASKTWRRRSNGFLATWWSDPKRPSHTRPPTTTGRRGKPRAG